MKPDTVKWILGMIIGVLITYGGYFTMHVVPKLAFLEAEAAHFQLDGVHVGKKLDCIHKELSQVNERLARIETKLGN